MKSMNVAQKVLLKAERLVKEGRVKKISDNLYYVKGFHLQYFVRIDNGKLYCICDGFKKKGFCSHILAVMIYRSQEKSSK